MLESTNRWILRACFLLSLSGVLLISGSAIGQNGPPTAYVDTFIGCEGGNTFTGACQPFGLVRAGLDVKKPHPTTGYTSNGVAEGISHTHTHGTGGGGRYGNVLAFGRVGEPDFKDRNHIRSDEWASPGQYHVKLKKQSGDYSASVTVVGQCALHEYWPKSWSTKDDIPFSILVDLGHTVGRATGDTDMQSRCLGFKARWLSDSIVAVVGTYAGGWGHSEPYRMYFAIQLHNRAIRRGIVNADSICSSGDSVLSRVGGVFWTWPRISQQGQVKFKVALSMHSMSSAIGHLDDVDSWNFKEQSLKANKSWSGLLSAIQVEDLAPNSVKAYYSALYRTVIMPTRFVAGDGIWGDKTVSYSEHYTLWDVARTVMPLHTLLFPARVDEMLNGLLSIYKRTGWLPDGYVAGKHAFIQGGTFADVALADGYLKGLKVSALWADSASTKNALTISPNPILLGRKFNNPKAYSDEAAKLRNGLSSAIEYSWCDYALSGMYKSMGLTKKATEFEGRANSITALFDTSQHLFAPKDSLGGFVRLAPDFAAPDSWNGPYFYEGTARQYSFGLHYNPAWLLDAFGGPSALESSLDSAFASDRFEIGNEPSFITPYLYLFCGRPDKTEKVLETILERKFNVSRNGLPGQDDSGALSAWLLWTYMGLYPMAGQPWYLLHAPRVRRQTILLPQSARRLNILRKGPEKAMYIQKVVLNGKRLRANHITHAQVIGGGTLTFIMGTDPICWYDKTRIQP